MREKPNLKTFAQKSAFADFMTSTRGYTPYEVARALNKQTPGVDWRRSSRSAMAEAWARGREYEGDLRFAQYRFLAHASLENLLQDLAADRVRRGK